MALINVTSATISGKATTKSPSAGEPKKLWDWYHAKLINDLEVSTARAKETWGDGGRATEVVSGPNFKTYKNAKTGALQSVKDLKDRSIEGQKVSVELRVGGRLVKNIFDPRIIRRSKEDKEVLGSRETAVMPHQKVCAVLEEITEAVRSATKDSALGKAIHETAKAATDPANRVKDPAEKAAVRAARPYDPTIDNFKPA
tara:strand:- start:217 stop:816 length:600 start_codon:yes stop_codon:yes gene_type:complete